MSPDLCMHAHYLQYGEFNINHTYGIHGLHKIYDVCILPFNIDPYYNIIVV